MRQISILKYFICLSFFIFSAVSSCMAADTPIAMPKEFLGYWEPYSKSTANVGLDIRPDGVINRLSNDKKREILTSGQYRIIKIENGYVFLITREEDGEYFRKASPKDNHDPYYQYIMLHQNWEEIGHFYRLTVAEPGMDYTHLHITETEWNQPIQFHLQRIKGFDPERDTTNGAVYAKN